MWPTGLSLEAMFRFKKFYFEIQRCKVRKYEILGYEESEDRRFGRWWKYEILRWWKYWENIEMMKILRKYWDDENMKYWVMKRVRTGAPGDDKYKEI